MSKNLTKIIVSVILCLFVGILCLGAIQYSLAEWESTNVPIQISSELFIIIWMSLYILIGVSAGIVWTKGFYHKWVKTALYHFGFQLLLNALWFMIFFGFHKPFWALLVIVTQFILILLTYKWFRIVNHLAGYLLFPYFVWVGFLAVFTCRMLPLVG